MNILKLIGYEKPTEVQELARNPIMKGKDTLIVSPTGSGKTLAAMIPIFEKILKTKERIEALYITPLRALNRDVFQRIIKIGSKIGIEVDIRHGDTPSRIRRMQRFDPPNILITTPETLQAILVGKTLRRYLKNVKYVIVDEIHEICESKRGAQLSVALERLKEISGDFQRIGLSATVSDPKLISKFLSQKEVEVIDVRKKKMYEIKVEIKKNVREVIGRIKEIIEKSRGILIFTNTRETAEALSSRLIDEGISVGVHHSSLSKEVRIRMEREFKEGKIKAIVATSSLELGIDIGSVDVVIQYGSPRQVIKLIQRIGRSGHRIEKTSIGYIINLNPDDYAESLSIKELFEKGWMEKVRIPENCLDVLAHQIVGICIDVGEIEKEKVYDIVKRAYPFRNLSYQKFVEVVEFLKRIKLIGEEEKIYRTRRGLLYYFENLSTIPDEKNYVVIDVEENKKIGILHEGFVSEHVYEGASFVMKGEPWKVVEIEGNKIKVVKTEEIEVAIPSWEGELLPVEKEVAEKSCEIKKKLKIFEPQERYGFPDCKNIIIEESKDFTVIHSCLGNRINQTIGKVIGAIISSITGREIAMKIDQYRIVMKLPYDWNYKRLEETILETDPKWVRDIIRHSLKNSSIFEHKFLQVGKRFGIIKKELEFSKGIVGRLIKYYSNTPVIEETINEIIREKMDVESTIKIFKMIKEGKIKIVGEFNYELSPIAMSGINYSSVSLIRPREESEIISIVKNRLMKKKFYYVCMKCGYSIGEITTENLKIERCPKCGAKTIAFVPLKEKEIAMRVVKKSMKGEPMNREERQMLKKLRESSELFLNYGKIGVFVMGGFGIGLKTAKRILRYHKDEKHLIKRIIEEERKFITNRKFWST